MDSDSISAGQGDDNRISPVLLEALAGLDAETSVAVSQVIVLHREFPAWALWLPHGSSPWTAVRPASARAPGPDLPMIWVHADTAAELAARMRSADAQLALP